MYANCCGLLLIVVFIQLFVTAALHALILILLYLLISGLGYPGLVVFQHQNIFLIKNKQQEPYTSSKQQERHNKNTVLKSPAWVPDDRIYNNTGRAYHYQQSIRTMAHIRGSQANNTLMNHLQHKLQTALYFSALDPSLMPVHLQTQRAQLLLEHCPS